MLALFVLAARAPMFLTFSGDGYSCAVAITLDGASYYGTLKTILEDGGVLYGERNALNGSIPAVRLYEMDLETLQQIAYGIDARRPQ